MTVLDFPFEAIHGPSPYSPHDLSIELAMHPGEWGGARSEFDLHLRDASNPLAWYYTREDCVEVGRLLCLAHRDIDEDGQGAQIHLLDDFPDLGC